jgi:hypothetical protein
MSSEIFHGRQEIEADHNFLLALGAVQTRFNQVAEIHRSSDYPHMLIGGHPHVRDPLGVFTLVESYDRLIRGYNTEVLRLEVPLAEPDPEQPEGRLWGRGYFVLTWRGQGREWSGVVDVASYLQLFSQPDADPPVPNLTQKILSFELVPAAVDP